MPASLPSGAFTATPVRTKAAAVGTGLVGEDDDAVPGDPSDAGVGSFKPAACGDLADQSDCDPRLVADPLRPGYVS
jgi:hypothetical protein